MKKKILIYAAVIAAAAVSAEKSHTVVKQDNLWNLSSEYLGNPFNWPMIWNANPQIKNPHLIYPGDKIAIPNLPANSGDSGNGVKNLSGQELADALQNYYSSRSDLYSSAVLRSAPYLEPSDSTSLIAVGKISDKSRQLYGLNNIVTVKAIDGQKFAVGEQYDIAHIGKSVSLNSAKASVVTPVGSAVVIKSTNEIVQIRITDCWNKISNGDRLEPIRPITTLQKPKVTMDAAPFETSVLVKINKGEAVKPYHTMILNAGKSNDVKVGDLFVGTALNKKGEEDTNPCFRGIVVRSDNNSSTILVEEVSRFSNSEKFSVKRVGRISFE